MQDSSSTLYAGYMLSVCYPRWVLSIMDYTGILRPRGAPFSGWRDIKQGRRNSFPSAELTSDLQLKWGGVGVGG